MDKTVVEKIQSANNAAARSKASKMPAQAIKLYYLPPSPPCRAVMMTARVLGLDLNLVLTNIMEGAHMTPEYLKGLHYFWSLDLLLTNIMEKVHMTPEYMKMNPQHTIPTMDDNGFILWESRAIMAYFVNAYGRDDSLYPKNPRLRAMVDQRLNFDVGTLYARYLGVYVPVLFKGEEMSQESVDKLNEALGWLNTMLEGKTFVAGDNLTIADITIVVTFTNLDALKYDFSEYDNITPWFERTKKALEPYGYMDIDYAGGQILASFLKKE